MYSPANLLILDEPTNHLDISSREELEILLKSFNGTVLFVSHDRRFINNIANRVVELKDGKLISYDGNYEYYKEKYKNEKEDEYITENSPIYKKTLVSSSIIKSPELKCNQWKKNHLEDQINELEDKLKVVEQKLSVVSDDYESIGELYLNKESMEHELEELMEEYYSL